MSNRLIRKIALELWLGLMTVCAVLFAVCFTSHETAAAESVYVKKKIVSLVYDTSGSMVSGNNNSRWVYAQYAMETLEGLMNNDDTLYLNKMSDENTTYTVDITDAHIQSAVDEYANMDSSAYKSGTPYRSVENAMNNLKTAATTCDENTQLWLVVLTDGEFNGTGHSLSELPQQFLNFVNSTQTANGSSVNVIYLGMGASSLSNETVKTYEQKGIYFKFADSSAQIVDMMREISAMISGRTDVSDTLAQADDKTIDVSLSMPLTNLALLVQNTQAKIVSVTDDNGNAISVGRQAAIKSVGMGLNLTGSTYLLRNTAGLIESKKVHITFDRAVAVGDISAMIEPAVELRPTFLLNGNTVTLSDLIDSHEEDELRVSFDSYVTGTDTLAADWGPLPTTTYRLTYEVNGVTEQTINGKQLNPVTLTQKTTKITMTMSMAGFNDISVSYTFTPKAPVLRVETVDLGTGNTIHYDDLADNGTARTMGIGFRFYRGAKPVTDQSVVAGKYTIGGGDNGVTVWQDGVLYFYPNAGEFSYTDDYRDLTVTCTIDNSTASSTYRIVYAKYEVVWLENDGEILQTALYQNQIGAHFCVLKNGVRLTKDELGTVSATALVYGEEVFNRIAIADDGEITVTPYVEEEYDDDFFMAWYHFWSYINAFGGPVDVTVATDFGTVTHEIGSIAVSHSVAIWSAFAFWGVVIVVVALVIIGLVRFFGHGRFPKDAKVYVTRFEVGKDYIKCKQVSPGIPLHGAIWKIFSNATANGSKYGLDFMTKWRERNRTYLGNTKNNKGNYLCVTVTDDDYDTIAKMKRCEKPTDELDFSWGIVDANSPISPGYYCKVKKIPEEFRNSSDRWPVDFCNLILDNETGKTKVIKLYYYEIKL